MARTAEDTVRVTASHTKRTYTMGRKVFPLKKGEKLSIDLGKDVTEQSATLDKLMHGFDAELAQSLYGLIYELMQDLSGGELEISGTTELAVCPPGGDAEVLPQLIDALVMVFVMDLGFTAMDDE